MLAHAHLIIQSSNQINTRAVKPGMSDAATMEAQQYAAEAARAMSAGAKMRCLRDARTCFQDCFWANCDRLDFAEAVSFKFGLVWFGLVRLTPGVDSLFLIFYCSIPYI